MIEIYVDGACSNNGKPDANTGVGVYSKALDISESYRFGFGTNNTAEFLAILNGINIVDSHHVKEPVVIYSDSKYVLNSIKKNWKIKSTISRQMRDYIQVKLNTNSNIQLKYIQREHNVLADDLAKNGKEKEQIDNFEIGGKDILEAIQSEYSKKENKEQKKTIRM